MKFKPSSLIGTTPRQSRGLQFLTGWLAVIASLAGWRVRRAAAARSARLRRIACGAAPPFCEGELQIVRIALQGLNDRDIRTALALLAILFGLGLFGYLAVGWGTVIAAQGFEAAISDLTTQPSLPATLICLALGTVLLGAGVSMLYRSARS